LALYYLETSALVKLYVREPGTERLLSIVDPSAGHRFVILSIAQTEFHSAVRRRERAGDLASSTATELLERFDLHARTKFLRQSVNDLVVDAACGLIARHPLRAYDALQLAGCLVLRSAAGEAPGFVCADRLLLQAAEAEGLVWLDPTA